MDPRVRELFHSVADLEPAARARVYEQSGFSETVRAEVESLISFNSTDSLTGVVSRAARQMLEDGAADVVRRCGPYRLVRMLGAGGMGSVYLGERSDGEIEQQVAIKMLRSDRTQELREERFLQERQLLASLKHPSIVHVFDAGRTPSGQPYLVMEYVDGETLDRFAQKLSLDAQLRLFLAVCDGVSHAHQHLIIHRDLKPSNILVDGSGQPKVLDFGIAKLLGGEEAAMTQTADRLLTPGYASPEQLRGEAQSTSTDIYSLGAVLYKMLTGNSPHHRPDETGTASLQTNTLDVMLGRLEIRLPSSVNPALPSDLDYIVKKALRHEPEDRYASVAALAGDIQALLESRPVEARSGNAWYRARRYVRRHRASLAAVALVILSLSGGLYVANRQRLIAERRFNQLRQVSKRLLQLDDSLYLLPGATKVREQVVTTSQEYLAALGQDAIGDDELSLEIADAYLKVGRVQGVSWSYNLGHYADGRNSLEQGRHFVEAVLSRDPKNRKALWLATSICHDLGAVADTLGDFSAGVAYSHQTDDWLKRLIALGDLQRADVNMAAYTYANLAHRFRQRNEFAEALPFAQAGVDVSREARTIPGPKTQALAALSAVQRQLGDLDRAMDSARKAREVYEGGVWDNEIYHKNVSTMPNIAFANLYCSPDGIDLGNPAAAADLVRASLAVSEGLIRENSKNGYMRQKSAILGDGLGMILASLDPPAALQAFDLAIKRAHELGNDADGQRLEALALADSAATVRKLGRPAESERRVTESLRLLRNTKDLPVAILIPWSEPETAQRALAGHYADTGTAVRAIEAYQDGLGRILAGNPDLAHNLPNAMCVSRYWSALAVLMRHEKRTDEAAALDVKRLELWRSWDQARPNHPVIRRQLIMVEGGLRHTLRRP